MQARLHTISSNVAPCLEVITHSALEIARADYANLHFPLDPRYEHNTYDIWAGAPLSRTLKPRPGGLAERAIKTAHPGFLSGRSLAKFNPKAYAAGVHAMAVYPLIINEGATSGFTRRSSTEAKTGALYVAFKEEHLFTEDEKDGLQLFTNLAEDAIRQAMHSMDAIHTARQLANLHDISRSLADEADHENLLESIAGHSLNVLAADLVLIYEYDRAQQLFLSKPATAGRREARSGEPGVSDGLYTPPLHLMNLKGTEHAGCAEKLAALYAPPGADTTCRCFVERERLVTGAAVPLCFGDEAVGIIFVNYRRSHLFSKYELSIIETLASTAAIAIQYRRLLQGRQRAILVMTHQLRNSLNTMREKILQAKDQLENRGRLKAKKQLEAKEQLVRIADQLGSFDDWNDALFVSLQDAGEPAAPEPDNIDIHEEINGVWELVKSARAGCDLTFRLSGPDSGDRTTHMNRGVFRNVLYSLFDNARKYADRGSELLVEWTVRPAVIKVRSSGALISPDEREKIFKKFSQGREVARKKVPSSGIGLGLWVTRRLLTLAGGSIGLEPDLQNPRATTFVVRLPDTPVAK